MNQSNPSERHYLGHQIQREFTELDECPIQIENIGWILGNDCTYRCTQCYSMSARRKGMNLSKEHVDRIVSELVKNNIKTVNLGGNEPIFTNGLDISKSLLPYILEQLVSAGIEVGVTTSGISLVKLEELFPESLAFINDVDVSLDSPYEDEHNKNRGANIFQMALKALKICGQYKIDSSIIICGMNWNFTLDRLDALLQLAKNYGTNLRVNTLKPVEEKHMLSALTPEQYYSGFSFLMEHCEPIDLGEPPLATVTRFEEAKGCPCGRTSFRIHSITPSGEVPISPCVYLHDYKVGNLLKDDLADIIQSEPFKTFRRRNQNPSKIPGCDNCSLIESCRGGCAARSYLYHFHQNRSQSLFSKDPYCPRDIAPEQNFPQNPKIQTDVHLVHKDYLCTWIGQPK